MNKLANLRKTAMLSATTAVVAFSTVGIYSQKLIENRDSKTTKHYFSDSNIVYNYDPTFGKFWMTWDEAPSDAIDSNSPRTKIAYLKTDGTVKYSTSSANSTKAWSTESEKTYLTNDQDGGVNYKGPEIYVTNGNNNTLDYTLVNSTERSTGTNSQANGNSIDLIRAAINRAGRFASSDTGWASQNSPGIGASTSATEVEGSKNVQALMVPDYLYEKDFDYYNCLQGSGIPHLAKNPDEVATDPSKFYSEWTSLSPDEPNLYMAVNPEYVAEHDGKVKWDLLIHYPTNFVDAYTIPQGSEAAKSLKDKVVPVIASNAFLPLNYGSIFNFAQINQDEVQWDGVNQNVFATFDISDSTENISDVEMINKDSGEYESIVASRTPGKITVKLPAAEYDYGDVASYDLRIHSEFGQQVRSASDDTKLVNINSPDFYNRAISVNIPEKKASLSLFTASGATGNSIDIEWDAYLPEYDTLENVELKWNQQGSTEEKTMDVTNNKIVTVDGLEAAAWYEFNIEIKYLDSSNVEQTITNSTPVVAGTLGQIPVITDESLSVSDIKYNSAVLNWNIDMPSYDEINSIKIRTFKNDDLVHPILEGTGDNVATGSLKVEDLTEAESYSFKLIAKFAVPGYDEPQTVESNFVPFETQGKIPGRSTLTIGDDVTGDTINDVTWTIPFTKGTTIDNVHLIVKDGETIVQDNDVTDSTNLTTGVGNGSISGLEQGKTYKSYIEVGYNVMGYGGIVQNVDSYEKPTMAMASIPDKPVVELDDLYENLINVKYTATALPNTSCEQTFVDVYEGTEATGKPLQTINATSTTDSDGTGIAAAQNLQEDKQYTFVVRNEYFVRGYSDLQEVSSIPATGSTSAGAVGGAITGTPKVIADTSSAKIKYYYSHGDDEFVSVDIINNETGLSMLDTVITNPLETIIDIDNLTSDTTYNLTLVLNYINPTGEAKQIKQKVEQFTTQSSTESLISEISVSETKEKVNVQFSILSNDYEISDVMLIIGNRAFLPATFSVDGNKYNGIFTINKNDTNNETLIKAGTKYNFTIKVIGHDKYGKDLETNNIITSANYTYVTKFNLLTWIMFGLTMIMLLFGISSIIAITTIVKKRKGTIKF